MITHGSVLRAVTDYVLIALKGKGQVIIADAPMYTADFERIVRLTGTDSVVEFYRQQGYPISLIDLRVEFAECKDHLVVERIPLVGDPKGYCVIDLGEHSEFIPVSHLSRRYRGSDYDSEETIQHHNEAANEYYISRTVLEADVVINVPKLKTHMKAGVTLNLKNMIGINGDKNWIPHFRLGSVSRGGDEFPGNNLVRELESLTKDRFKDSLFGAGSIPMFFARHLRKVQKALVERTGFAAIRNGSWYGNDTLWRSVLDLNKILFYADKEGVLGQKRQRRYFSVVDGIIGGEGDGPVLQTPKPCGVVVAGQDPIAVDLCAIRLMGFDWTKIPKVARALQLDDYKLSNCAASDVELKSDVSRWCELLADGSDPFLEFVPPRGWKGHIEINSREL